MINFFFDLVFISSGEVYVSFFNLNEERMTISMQISDLGNVFPGKDWSNVSCTREEVWSNTKLGMVQKSIAFPVETHGTALFVLSCQ